MARGMIDRFEPLKVDAIIVSAAGCGAALKDYRYLLRDDPAYCERALAFRRNVKTPRRCWPNYLCARPGIPCRCASDFMIHVTCSTHRDFVNLLAPRCALFRG